MKNVKFLLSKNLFIILMNFTVAILNLILFFTDNEYIQLFSTILFMLSALSFLNVSDNKKLVINLILTVFAIIFIVISIISNHWALLICGILSFAMGLSNTIIYFIELFKKYDNIEK